MNDGNQGCGLFLGVIILGLGLVVGVAGWYAVSESGSAGQSRITVAAASDLYYAFRDVREEFEAQHSIRVQFSFGSSGMLAQQIHEGAPIDVYA